MRSQLYGGAIRVSMAWKMLGGRTEVYTEMSGFISLRRVWVDRRSVPVQKRSEDARLAQRRV